MKIQWVAVYNDDTVLPQYMYYWIGTRENKYKDIDRSKLLFFDLFDMEQKKILIRVHFDDPRKRLIYRRRKKQRQGGGEQVVWLAGWQMTVKGENVQMLSCLNEAGETIITGGWREPFSFPPPYSFEK